MWIFDSFFRKNLQNFSHFLAGRSGKARKTCEENNQVSEQVH
jgi:hypothetical protein